MDLLCIYKTVSDNSEAQGENVAWALIGFGLSGTSESLRHHQMVGEASGYSEELGLAGVAHLLE